MEKELTSPVVAPGSSGGDGAKVTDQLLDEDGYCRKTDLLPYECGCAAHRGGVVVDLEVEPRPESKARPKIKTGNVRQAQYDGECALEPLHAIAVGDVIARAIDAGTYAPIGWVCEACAFK